MLVLSLSPHMIKFSWAAAALPLPGLHCPGPVACMQYLLEAHKISNQINPHGYNWPLCYFVIEAKAGIPFDTQ